MHKAISRSKLLLFIFLCGMKFLSMHEWIYGLASLALALAGVVILYGDCLNTKHAERDRP